MKTPEEIISDVETRLNERISALQQPEVTQGDIEELHDELISAENNDERSWENVSGEHKIYESGIDLELFGIRFDGTNFEIAQRRVKIHSPDGVTSPANFTVGLTAWNVLVPATGTIYLNYNLDTATGAFSYTAGADSSIKLYDTLLVGDVTRIYHPGDIDLEAVWLDYVPPTP